MAKRRKPKLSKKEIKARAKIKARQSLEITGVPLAKEHKSLKKITLSKVIPIRVLAEKLGQNPIKILEILLKNGVVATINESLDFETAAIVADELGGQAVEEEEEKTVFEKEEEEETKYAERPPVVTVMGHVDHGKTKLLDTIRKTNVIEKEAGGITQHIGAYQAEVEIKEKKGKTKRLITFLDTPGHQAFSKMRAQGAEVTDIVVLVVASDDGVKPQTIEAISHARAARVPIIVAINKIDLPDADPERVKRELTQQKLVPEDWGGKTPMLPISAKEGTGIHELLEMIALVGDLQNLKAKTSGGAMGIIIETKMKPGKGASATVLVREGTLRQGDTIVASQTVGKIRIMEDFRGKDIKSAPPSTPVEISGLKALPKIGDKLQVVRDEKEAKVLGLKSKEPHFVKGIMTPEDEQGKQIKELKLIVKADVSGSLEAIKNQISEIKSESIKPNLISSGVGEVSESDVNLAKSTAASILAFRVTIPLQVLKLAQSAKVKISNYQIIYQLVDDVVSMLKGLIRPEIIETEIGEIKIIKVFFKTAQRGIVGGEVIKGQVRLPTKAKVLRGEQDLGTVEIESLKIGEANVDEVKSKKQCGVGYKGEIKLKIGDILKIIQTEERIETISSPSST